MTRSRFVLFSFAAAGVLLGAPASAQVATRSSVTLDGARRIIAAAVAEARVKNAPGGVIAVVDDGGNLIALERLDNTFAAGANISIGKARTAVLFKRPTRAFEEIIKNGRTAMVALDDFTPLQGGVPVVVNGQVVGGVGVSGAASAQQDEELAIAGANALTSPAADPEPNRPAVLYYSKEQVAASFATGGVLVGAEDSNEYMVHTSRRDRAGLAEVHARDTDIIYVTQGQATFVTGGTVPDAKPTAADELRGSAIQGGTTRAIAAGDVIVVPNGVAHWFKDVSAPFTYYVVKVRSAVPAPGTSGGQR
jgi:glc operon protein GlcG